MATAVYFCDRCVLWQLLPGRLTGRRSNEVVQDSVEWHFCRFDLYHHQLRDLGQFRPQLAQSWADVPRRVNDPVESGFVRRCTADTSL